MYLLDIDGEKKLENQIEILTDDFTKVWTMLLLSDKEKLMEHKDLFLPNDVLSLQFECFFTTGITLKETEEIGKKCASPQNGSLSKEKTLCNITKSLKDDLKDLYIDGILSDFKLCSPTETFSVHKSILSARSPVFRAMLTHETKEKSSNKVEISDVDSDTLRRMILYMYTDVLEETHWEDVSKLYIAADKYEIPALRSQCSSILKNELDSINACRILILADIHQDLDLKQFVQDFILKSGVDVISSKEWQPLMENNLKLAADTMRQNWVKMYK
ncbi:speckle-type POZ protein-like B [Nephila pilipes]|uniref:Speckle-type POZ protein-like B n=1 Tax=Nephila pilipes TaxID=299642 RepID=A0A8X6M931_NEPPI|nr:speckle-type POZ protein-like B [Nephila pilipes]